MVCSWVAPAILCSLDLTRAPESEHHSQASDTSWAWQRGSSLISLVEQKLMFISGIYCICHLLLTHTPQAWHPSGLSLLYLLPPTYSLSQCIATLKIQVDCPLPFWKPEHSKCDFALVILSTTTSKSSTHVGGGMSHILFTSQWPFMYNKRFYLQAGPRCSVNPPLVADYLALAGFPLGKLLSHPPICREIPMLQLYGSSPGWPKCKDYYHVSLDYYRRYLVNRIMRQQEHLTLPQSGLILMVWQASWRAFS